MTMKVGMLYSRMRTEEKMFINEAKDFDIEFIPIDDRNCTFDLYEPMPEWGKLDALLERTISHTRALYALSFFEQYGIPTINHYDIAWVCGDKILTSQRLARAGVPTPRTYAAFTHEAALDAIRKVGYPAVLKPVWGSWGRLIVKVDNEDMADAILEHKTILGGYMHHIYYIQEYIEKPGRDIRTFVVGDEVIAGIYRTSENWLTNTARGAKASNCPITRELREISLRAADAVGRRGVLAIDIMEGKDGYTVCEVNYTPEFKNSVAPTGVNIPRKILEFVVTEARS